MLAIERKSQIIAMLREKKKVVVSELSKLFNVTEETIRKDLKDLENNDFIVRAALTHCKPVLKLPVLLQAAASSQGMIWHLIHYQPLMLSLHMPASC